ncbi:hypothetical protein [Oceanobacillus saliphilus]|uniref:hypothetical protein n=1 Tax=Oceanobacillus saliphilus TaxID=2925834 RepID=UPI00201E1D41|nr:hypothetical protein [Oceanobacillus saliphilus]
MAAVSKLIAISFIIVSFIIGLISFYLVSDLPKQERKKQMDDMISNLTNFVIFIWIAKIILNFSIFMEDPLAILAYPSDSSAFYLALLFSGIFLYYKSLRKQMDVPMFVNSFIHVFIVASFLYEFIQFVWNDNPYSLGYMILLALLLVLFLFSHHKLARDTLTIMILTAWSAGMFILFAVQPYVTVFGYLMSPWFVAVFFVIGFTLILLNKRKKGLNGRN